MAAFGGALLGFLLALVLFLLKHSLMSFSAQKPSDYADGGPDFDVCKHLNGPVLCEGVVYGPLGRVVSRFVGDFEIEWDGARGVMRERFVYDSGEVQNRAWHLQVFDDGSIEARADDVIGLGRGRQCGPTVQLRYRIKLEEDAGGHVLDATDWMYLAPNGTIVNRSQFRKFGVKVAELVATMRKKEAA